MTNGTRINENDGMVGQCQYQLSIKAGTVFIME